MSYVTVEVDIQQGRVVPREPEKLPECGSGLLTIIEPKEHADVVEPRGHVKFPLIEGDGKHFINPTPEELDASAWD